MAAKRFVFDDYVRIYDTDAQGVVHYAGYYRFFTDAVEKFMSKIAGVNYPLFDSKVWFVVVESEAQYHRPAVLGDRLSITLTTSMPSKKALRFDFKIRKKGVDICSGHMVQVAIDRKHWKATNIPARLASRLAMGS